MNYLDTGLKSTWNFQLILLFGAVYNSNMKRDINRDIINYKQRMINSEMQEAKKGENERWIGSNYQSLIEGF